MADTKVLGVNKEYYEDRYAKGKLFLRYPMDHVSRFHAYHLRSHMPSGRVLDHGCGSGNNSVLFLREGYDVYGTDIADSALNQIKANLDMYGLDSKLIKNFQILPPDTTKFPYDDGFFDLILSNQVLYFLLTEERIRAMCREFSRILRPGGLVFFTMLGVKNQYYTHHLRSIHNGETCEVVIDDRTHRLNGLRQMFYVVRDADHLKNLFSDFEPVSVGHYEMSLFDKKSNFHWIFVGRKRAV